MSRQLISVEAIGSDILTVPNLTPRSLEACKKQGIDPRELVYKPLDHFKGRDIPLETAQLKYDYYEKKRISKLNLIKEERKNIPEMELSLSQRTLNSKNPAQQNLYSSNLLDKERRELERLERKQQMEIQQMIEFELRNQEIQKRKNEKAEKARQKEEARLKELEVKHREQEERRLREEERKRLETVMEEQEARRRAQDEHERTLKKKKEDERTEKQRRKEAKMRENERQKKQDEFKKRTDEMMQFQSKQIEQKKIYLDQRDFERKQIVAEMQTKKAEENAKVRTEKQTKLQTAKENMNFILQFKKKEFDEKLQITEKKRRKIEMEKAKEREIARQKAQQKEEERRKVQEMNTLIEEKRKLDIKSATDEAKKKFLEHLKRKDDEIRQKRLEEQQRKEEIEKVRIRNEEIEIERVSRILGRRAEVDEKVTQQKCAKELELKKRKDIEEIKRQDKIENVIRIAKQQEYARDKVLGKIQEENQRVIILKQAKDEIMEERRIRKEKAEAEKRKLLETFEKLKRGKCDLSTITDKLSSIVGSRMHTQSNSGISSPVMGTKGTPKLKQSPNTSRNTNTSDKNIIDMIQFKFQELKDHNCKELIELLDQEESAEYKREALLSQADDTIRRQLEYDFGIQRAKASERIITLNEKHKKAEKRLQEQLGAK